MSTIEDEDGSLEEQIVACVRVWLHRESARILKSGARAKLIILLKRQEGLEYDEEGCPPLLAASLSERYLHEELEGRVSAEKKENR